MNLKNKNKYLAMSEKELKNQAIIFIDQQKNIGKNYNQIIDECKKL